jgi:hypothetical protein
MFAVLTIIAAPTVTGQISDGSGAPSLELQQLLISVTARLAELEAER